MGVGFSSDGKYLVTVAAGTGGPADPCQITEWAYRQASGPRSRAPRPGMPSPATSGRNTSGPAGHRCPASSPAGPGAPLPAVSASAGGGGENVKPPSPDY